MALTRVTPALFATANAQILTSTTLGGANTALSLTFDESGVISTGANVALQVNTADIADGAITSAKIADGTVVAADVADDSVTVAKLSSSGDTRFYSPAANTLVAYTSTTERMRIDSSGYVGIGTDSPAGALEIIESGAAIVCASTFKSSNTAKSARYFSRSYANNFFTGLYMQSPSAAGNNLFIGGGTGTGEPATTIFFNTGTPGSAGAGTERMRIDSSGNVGIGTSSPNAKFHLQGTNASAVNTDFIYRPSGDNTNNFQIRGIYNASGSASGSFPNLSSGFSLDTNGGYGASSGFVIQSSSATPLIFGTSNTERMRIDSSGNLLLGNTSGLGAKFVIYGASGGTNSYIQITNPGYGTGTIGVLGTSSNFKIYNSYVSATLGTGAGIDIDTAGNVLINSTTTTSGGLSAQLFVKSDNTTGKYGIGVGYGTSALQWRIMYMNSGDGALYFHNGNNYATLSSAGAWTNASDERLKNNIVDIKYGLDTVLNTKPRSYKMNDVEGDFIGFVAQELQTVIPEVVSGDPEKQLGVDYGSLVAVAFKAIQEQQETIKALETRLQALEG